MSALLSARSRHRNGFKRAVSVLLAAMSMASHRQISFRPSVAQFGMYGTVHLSGWHFRPGFGRTCHEIVVKLCRALSCRYPVNCIVVRPERYGNVTNRNGLRHPASQRHGRRAEAGGKASSAGGKATRVRSGGQHSGISPDIANRSNTIGCARFSNGEACRA
jgi:hypothetical protein